MRKLDQADKRELMDALRDVFQRWEALLNGLTEKQITAPLLPSGQTIKDVIGHLWAWQQRSIIRMDAALNEVEPILPVWTGKHEVESRENLNDTNAWIHEHNQAKSWAQVHGEWKAGFTRLLDLAELMPEATLAQVYPWLEGYPLARVLSGSYEHHEEHLEPMADLLRETYGKH